MTAAGRWTPEADAAGYEHRAVLAKSRALIDLTKSRVAQIDPDRFPTPSSRAAQDLLRRALDLLGRPERLAAVDPEVLYNKLVALQELVAVVEASGRRVSWPLVSYCDAIWHSIFGDAGPQIFYAVAGEYNYSIRGFSDDLRDVLQDVLPGRDLATLDGGRRLYCLQLASLEHTNLPLYANIAHEFGHALFDAHAANIGALGADALGDVLVAIETDLATHDRPSPERRAARTHWMAGTLEGFFEELVADLCGALLAGPAFYCSLDEMSWGSNRAEWQVRLTRGGVRAYPSTHFRLDLIRRWAGVDRAAARVADTAASLESTTLAPVMRLLAGRARGPHEDRVTVLPALHPDRAALEQVLRRHLPALRDGLSALTDSCEGWLRGGRLRAAAPLDVPAVDALLLRLEHDLLPNVVPDGTLLGRPADFLSILNAAAFYRVRALDERDGAPHEPGETARQLGKIERLTEKALEVSYVQRKFQAPR